MMGVIGCSLGVVVEVRRWEHEDDAGGFLDCAMVGSAR